MNWPFREFLWGTSISAYQVEGNNKYSDWWHWELKNVGKPTGPKDHSGKAANFWNLYKKDLKLAKELGTNTIRLSIEWSRVLPKPNKVNKKAIKRYIDILKTAKDYGLYTFVTLHHFTLPLWIAQKGGFENKKNIKHFLTYIKTILPYIDKYTDALITINEPMIYTSQAYLKGRWPPQKRSLLSALKVLINMLNAHKQAYKSIKKMTPQKPVTIVFNLAWYHGSRDNKLLQIPNILLAKFKFYKRFLPLYYVKNHIDYIGLNYYFTNQFTKMRIKNPNDKVSDMGWWLTPQNIYYVLKELNRFKKPIVITENGLADAKDKYRPWFIKETIKAIKKAKQEGVDVRGYFHWSLLDNFEWADGFYPRFGLIEVDYQNFKRTPRKSYYVYEKEIKNAKLT